MSIGISVSARINASSSETWAALENINSHVQWMKDAESIHFTTAGRTRTGTEFVCVTKVGPIRLTDAMSITSWTPCDAMGVHHLKSRMHIHPSVRPVRDSRRSRTAYRATDRALVRASHNARVGTTVASRTAGSVWHLVAPGASSACCRERRTPLISEEPVFQLLLDLPQCALFVLSAH
jgi:hypothetical protein